MKLTQNQYSGLDKDKAGRSTPGAIYVTTDTKKIYIYDVNGIPRLATSNALGGANVVVDYYSQLPMDMDPESIAFVLNSQGTPWLPGTIGGTYYSAGWYIFRSGIWKHSRELVDQQLDVYDKLISDNTTLINDHKNNLNNPHQTNKADVGLGNVDNTSDYLKPISNATQTALNNKASLAQGALADTALQPGDDISTLVNDMVYLQPTDNVSSLTNDAGYITGNTLSSYRTDITVSDIYSGYLINSVPTITKYSNGTLIYAQNVTDLEPDWANRLNLTYI